jgi:hypothetical protein
MVLAWAGRIAALGIVALGIWPDRRGPTGDYTDAREIEKC